MFHLNTSSSTSVIARAGRCFNRLTISNCLSDNILTCTCSLNREMLLKIHFTYMLVPVQVYKISKVKAGKTIRHLNLLSYLKIEYDQRCFTKKIIF